MKKLACILMFALVFASLPAFMPYEASADSILAVPRTGYGSNPENAGPVSLFKFQLVALPEIPAGLTNDPIYAAFSPDGELFVANRHGNVLNGEGSISRFIINSAGEYEANGTIEDNYLEAVHGLAFSPDGELFAANRVNGKISRFTFYGNGIANANGTIDSGLYRNNAVAFGPDGKLFVSGINSASKAVVKRYDSYFYPDETIDVSNTSPSAASKMVFSKDGELFVSVSYIDIIKRFKFDGNGQHVHNGEITLPGGDRPFGLAFDPAGELFVSTRDTSIIYRYVFDSDGTEHYMGGYDGEYTIPLGDIAIRNAGGF